MKHEEYLKLLKKEIRKHLRNDFDADEVAEVRDALLANAERAASIGQCMAVLAEAGWDLPAIMRHLVSIVIEDLPECEFCDAPMGGYDT